MTTWSPHGTSVHAKVGPKGQIVIPKEFRDRLGITPGSTVIIDLRPDDNVVTVEYGWDGSIAGGLDFFKRFPPLPGMEGKTAVELLHEMDREEEEVWERKYGHLPDRSSSSTPNRSSRPSGKSPGGRSSTSSSLPRKPKSSSSD